MRDQQAGGFRFRHVPGSGERAALSVPHEGVQEGEQPACGRASARGLRVAADTVGAEECCVLASHRRLALHCKLRQPQHGLY